MDATMIQPRGPSPKGNSALMSPSQSKPGLDNQQNSANSTPSQKTKGKKRERGGDHCSRDPFKTEEGSSKTDDGDSVSVKIEKLTEKGCLVGYESVEKLIEFILPNRIDKKKLDLVSRSMVASVIAATDRFDCLSHFVHLKGLTVLDEWLQDVHKGRINGLKDVEEFLLVLLRALDKLPVNLHALQTCNIGRSVNRLRSHRNSDIQRKARILVDIWKKRVEAEMNVLDAKSGSNQVATWSSKSSIGSYDVSLKSSVTQDSGSNPKIVLNKREETTLSLLEKEANKKINNNNSSVLSNNSSHSFPGQDKPKITVAGITNATKNSSGSSRHRKSSHKETLDRNNSINKSTVDEKVMPSSPSCEKTSSHRLIVKIPNRIEPARGSPAQSASGASFDNHSAVISSRASSPDHSNLKDNKSYMAANDNDHKDLQNESNDRGEAQSKNEDGNKKAFENDLNTLIDSCVKYSAPTTFAGDDDIGMNLLANVATREMSVSGTFQDENQKRDQITRSEGVLHNMMDDNEIRDDDVSGVKATVISEPLVGPTESRENESSPVFDGCEKLKRQKLCVTVTEGVVGSKMEETTSTVDSRRLDFDLNEGLSGNDGKCGDTSVPSAVKGPFVPPVNLLSNKGEIGWKGSSTMSAFRPVEPRKKIKRLDFDLNVADERLLEDDMGCQDSIGLDLGLKRDFDLNSGPGFDDDGVGSLSMNSISPVFGVPPKSLEAINLSTWLPSATSYSSVVVGPSTPDMYRGSSQVVPFPSGPYPYPYQMFPFGTTFSVGSGSTSSGRFFNNPALNSQFLAPVVSEISSQYPKKYMFGMHEGSDKWSRQNFDLNAGPGVPEVVEGREDFIAQRRQLYVSGGAQEQGRIYPTADNSVFKRKDPETGLDRESFRYKQPSWH